MPTKLVRGGRLGVAVPKLTGMDEATLIRLENSRQPNPTVDTLWRYASAVGRRLVLTHVARVAKASRHSRWRPYLTFKSIVRRMRMLDFG